MRIGFATLLIDEQYAIGVVVERRRRVAPAADDATVVDDGPFRRRSGEGAVRGHRVVVSFVEVADHHAQSAGFGTGRSVDREVFDRGVFRHADDTARNGRIEIDHAGDRDPIRRRGPDQLAVDGVADHTAGFSARTRVGDGFVFSDGLYRRNVDPDPIVGESILRLVGGYDGAVFQNRSIHRPDDTAHVDRRPLFVSEVHIDIARDARHTDLNAGARRADQTADRQRVGIVVDVQTACAPDVFDRGCDDLARRRSRPDPFGDADQTADVTGPADQRDVVTVSRITVVDNDVATAGGTGVEITGEESDAFGVVGRDEDARAFTAVAAEDAVLPDR